MTDRMNAALHYPQYAHWPYPGWRAPDHEAVASGCGPEDDNDWRRAFPDLAWDGEPLACMCGATHGRTHDIGDGLERCIECGCH